MIESSSLHYRRHYFSLAELIVAMSLLLMLMGLLFKFVIQAQKLWQVDEANARIYQNSRTVFNIIGRDLQTMVTSNITDREIKYTNDASSMSTVASVTNIAAWVTASGIGAEDEDSSKLIEVGYFWDASAYSLKRVMSTSTYEGASVSQWDFFNAEPSSWAATWEPEPVTRTSPARGTILANGVKSAEITFYDSAMAELSAGSYNSKPSMALITLELFDPHAVVGSVLIEAERNRTLRKISKMIFLPVEE
jgi:hypothetical protein